MPISSRHRRTKLLAAVLLWTQVFSGILPAQQAWPQPNTAAPRPAPRPAQQSQAAVSPGQWGQQTQPPGQAAGVTSAVHPAVHQAGQFAAAPQFDQRPFAPSMSPQPQLRQVQYAEEDVRPPLDHRLQAMPSDYTELQVIENRSQLVITRQRVRRMNVTDPNIIRVVNYSETEFAIMGQQRGTTDLMIWFEGSSEPLMYLVTCIEDPSYGDRRTIDYGKIEKKIALLYPNSKIFLIPLSYKVIVRGQARDAEEAARILQIVRDEVISEGGDLVTGSPAIPDRDDDVDGYDYLSSYIIDELTVPGEYQVMLRVKMAELSRSQLRELGVDWTALINSGRHAVSQTLGNIPVLTGVFNQGEFTVLLDFLASNGTAKILEDTVVTTMSGNPATFQHGGSFAVPSTIGVGGIAVGTTTFRNFGVSLVATPTVVDHDLIRIRIAPELSSIDNSTAVGGIPGVNGSSVSTMVELREGQTIVLGAQISRRQQAEVTRVPLLGEIPVIGSYLFNRKMATEDETEMLIVVTPEIVRPMDPDDLPPMPGFNVTHPDDHDLYKYARTEGNPNNGVYQLLPYGNGNGYATDVGYSIFNPPTGPGNIAPQQAPGYGPAAAPTPAPAYGEPASPGYGGDYQAPVPMNNYQPHNYPPQNAEPQNYYYPGSPQPNAGFGSQAAPQEVVPTGGYQTYPSGHQSQQWQNQPMQAPVYQQPRQQTFQQNR